MRPPPRYDVLAQPRRHLQDARQRPFPPSSLAAPYNDHLRPLRGPAGALRHGPALPGSERPRSSAPRSTSSTARPRHGRDRRRLGPRTTAASRSSTAALAYWLMAASIGGRRPTAARHASCPRRRPRRAGATLWLGAVPVRRATAVMGALVLATTGAFVGFGHVAMSDMLLALCSTLAVAIAARRVAGAARRRVAIALAAALGLGFLTKGPVRGCCCRVPPRTSLAGRSTARRSPAPGARARRRPRPRCSSSGAAAVRAGRTAAGPGPLEHFFLRENLQRFAGVDLRRARPVLVLRAAPTSRGAPWSLLFPLAAWHACRRERAPAASCWHGSP